MHPLTKQAIERDIRLAEGVFGAGAVFWPPSLAWLRINGYKLPCIYNRQHTDIIIRIPPHYGLINVPLEEFYLDEGLRLWNKNNWTKIPHYHEGKYLNAFTEKYWVWFCLHPRSWKTSDNILTFIKLVDLMFQDPMNWNP
ncbi:MAG: hypothetical protein EOM23_00355 [Candidatus Moranbacteria bacterium]|nr:hypothetical protein [Candidatus Moranbacteria bacterium]